MGAGRDRRRARRANRRAGNATTGIGRLFGAVGSTLEGITDYLGTGGLIDDARDFFTGNRQTELNQETFEYNKELQKTQFAREDTAMQRRAADLEAAGLSQTLAAGGAGAATTIKPLQAPQNTRREAMQNSMSQMAQMIQLNAQVGQTKAQTKLLEQQRYKQAEETQLLKTQRTRITQETQHAGELQAGKVTAQNLANTFNAETLNTRITQIRANLRNTTADIALKEQTGMLRQYQIQPARVQAIEAWLQTLYYEGANTGTYTVEGWTTHVDRRLTPSTTELNILAQQLAIDMAKRQYKLYPVTSLLGGTGNLIRAIR